MAIVQCVNCEVRVCEDSDIENTPEFCPRRHAREALEEAQEISASDPEVSKYIDVAASVGREGRGQWTRVQELAEFAKRIGVSKLGLAFCVGLKEEATMLAKILESHGFDLTSVACTVEGGCNPVGQALILNQMRTELNISMGLCMGDDIVFSKFSQAPVTTIVVKDRATYHNPIAPLASKSPFPTLLKSVISDQ